MGDKTLLESSPQATDSMNEIVGSFPNENCPANPTTEHDYFEIYLSAFGAWRFADDRKTLANSGCPRVVSLGYWLGPIEETSSNKHVISEKEILEQKEAVQIGHLTPMIQSCRAGQTCDNA